MSRWSVPEPTGGSSDGRGQVDPLPALVAVAVIGVALSLYASVLAGRPGGGGERGATAEVTLGAVCERICDGGRVAPDRLRDGLAAAPEGYRLRITLRADGTEWTVGPTPPDDTAVAERTVSVRLGPGETVPGRLAVVVWR
jgi:hypothetical protein